MAHLYEAVNLPGIDDPPPFHLSLICNLLYEPFFGGGDGRLRPPGNAKRHFIGQQGRRRANLLPGLQNLLWIDNKSYSYNKNANSGWVHDIE